MRIGITPPVPKNEKASIIYYAGFRLKQEATFSR